MFSHRLYIESFGISTAVHSENKVTISPENGFTSAIFMRWVLENSSQSVQMKLWWLEDSHWSVRMLLSRHGAITAQIQSFTITCHMLDYDYDYE